MGSGGGSASANERFFKVQFPEKPGSLRRFLDAISDQWNITLFHYRFSGALIGDVFLGIAPMEKEEVENFKAMILNDLGWESEDVTGNEACEML